jgi:histidinol dehydrogenase
MILENLNGFQTFPFKVPCAKSAGKNQVLPEKTLARFYKNLLRLNINKRSIIRYSLPDTFNSLMKVCISVN